MNGWLLRVVGIAFTYVCLVTTVDFVLYRDPWIELSRGYAIGSISTAVPVALFYRPHADVGTSDWRSRIVTISDGDSIDTEYWLSNKRTTELLVFESEEAWRKELKKRNARPPEATILRQITGYMARDDVIYGSYRDGYFVCQADEYEWSTFDSKREWSEEVSALTGQMPLSLRNPLNRLYWTRDLEYLAFIVVTTIILVVYSVGELVLGLLRRRQAGRLLK